MTLLKKLFLLTTALLIRFSESSGPESSRLAQAVTRQFEKKYQTLTQNNYHPTFAQMVSCSFFVTEEFETNQETFDTLFQEIKATQDRTYLERESHYQEALKKQVADELTDYENGLIKGHRNSETRYKKNNHCIPFLQQVVMYQNATNNQQKTQLLREQTISDSLNITKDVFNSWFVGCLSTNNFQKYFGDRQSKSVEMEFEFMYFIANLIDQKIRNKDLVKIDEKDFHPRLFDLILDNKCALKVLDDFGFELVVPLWHRLLYSQITKGAAIVFFLLFIPSCIMIKLIKRSG